MLGAVRDERDVLARLEPQHGRDVAGLLAGEKGPLGGRGVDEESVHGYPF